MTDQRHNESETTQPDEYMKGGKGRRDEVGGSGIYPASSPDAPADAEIRSEGELAKHKGPPATSEQRSKKGDLTSGSE
jgi:hypothetical protein